MNNIFQQNIRMPAQTPPRSTSLGYTTKYQLDFTPPKIQETKQIKAKGELGVVDLPLNNMTSYKTQYINWGSNTVDPLKPPSHTGVIKDMNFFGRTIYQDNFYKKPFIENKNFKPIVKKGYIKSPFNPNFPFLGDTSTKQAFRPFKTMKKTDNNNIRKIDPGLTYSGQFVSQSKKDYSDKSNVCPAKEELNKKKEKEISDIFSQPPYNYN